MYFSHCDYYFWVSWYPTSSTFSHEDFRREDVYINSHGHGGVCISDMHQSRAVEPLRFLKKKKILQRWRWSSLNVHFCPNTPRDLVPSWTLKLRDRGRTGGSLSTSSTMGKSGGKENARTFFDQCEAWSDTSSLRGFLLYAIISWASVVKKSLMMYFSLPSFPPVFEAFFSDLDSLHQLKRLKGWGNLPRSVWKVWNASCAEHRGSFFNYRRSEDGLL